MYIIRALLLTLILFGLTSCYQQGPSDEMRLSKSELISLERGIRLLKNSPYLKSSEFSPKEIAKINDSFLKEIESDIWLTPNEIKSWKIEHNNSVNWNFESSKGRLIKTPWIEIAELIRKRQIEYKKEYPNALYLPQLKDIKNPNQNWDEQKNSFENGEKPWGIFDHQQLFQATLTSIAKSKDPHTHYVPPSKAQAFQQALSLYSIETGATFESKKEQIFIQNIQEESPISKTAASIGDIILSIKEKDQWVGVSLNSLQNHILLNKDTLIYLKIEKENGEQIEISLTPKAQENNQDKIKITYEKWGVEQTPIARIKITFLYDGGFEKQHSIIEDMQNVLKTKELLTQKALVLDLRECRGGSISNAMLISGMFSEAPFFMQIRSSEERIQEIPNPSKSKPIHKPLYVWIDRKTMSACEMIAQTLKDTIPSTEVIGWNSFGKGTYQTRHLLSDEQEKSMGEIWITSGEIYSITGKSLQKTGVSPTCMFPGDVSTWGEEALQNSLPPRENLQNKSIHAEKNTYFAKLPQIQNPYINRDVMTPVYGYYTNELLNNRNCSDIIFRSSPLSQSQ